MMLARIKKQFLDFVHVICIIKIYYLLKYSKIKGYYYYYYYYYYYSKHNKLIVMKRERERERGENLEQCFNISAILLLLFIYIYIINYILTIFILFIIY